MRRFARFNLFVAFAFTVMTDPVSSVAYAMEAALGQLDGDLSQLVVTMALVVATIAVVAAGYHQLIRRFPNGGGGAEGPAAAFGEGWAFLPVGPARRRRRTASGRARSGQPLLRTARRDRGAGAVRDRRDLRHRRARPGDRPVLRGRRVRELPGGDGGGHRPGVA